MTFLHKIKCAHCSLHFIAFSWKKDWHPKGCPECLTKFTEVGGYMHWMETSGRQIYEYVPGYAAGKVWDEVKKAMPHPNDVPVEEG